MVIADGRCGACRTALALIFIAAFIAATALLALLV
jgi:hypothetical protein